MAKNINKPASENRGSKLSDSEKAASPSGMGTSRQDWTKEAKIASRFVERQIGFAEELIERLHTSDLVAQINERIAGTTILASSVTSTANSVVALSGHHDFSSAFVLARGLVEQIINYCYLFVCDDTELQRWVKYSVQKAYRQLDRTAAAGDFRVKVSVSPLPAPQQFPGLEEALKMFTSLKGKALTRWTNLSLSERLDVVRKRAKDFDKQIEFLLLAIVSVYDEGSEILHGTFYGVGGKFGLFRPPGHSHSGLEWELKWSTAMCLDAFVRMGATLAKFDDLVVASDASVRSAAESIAAARKESKINRPYNR